MTVAFFCLISIAISSNTATNAGSNLAIHEYISNLTFSEDTDFGSRASKRHPKEEFVNKVLYKHLWNTEISTGKTGQNLAPYEYIECFPNENLTEHLIYAEI